MTGASGACKAAAIAAGSEATSSVPPVKYPADPAGYSVTSTVRAA